MGYSRYTGYSVNGVDVFIWVLLTAGSVGFPMLVLTICCIKNRIKRRSNALLNSESNLKINQLSKPMKNNFSETSINERYNHVRFNEDSLRTKNNNNMPKISEPIPKTKFNNYNTENPNIQDLRNFKQLSGNLLPNNSYRQNELINSRNVLENLPSLPSIPIYSVADSYRNTGQVNTSYRKEDSFENLYSQIPSKKNTNVVNSNKDEYNDDNQPVYMNSHYNGE